MFTKKDTICFYGDSITAAGLWETEVFPYLNGAKIFNCGVPADDTNAACLRIYETCLIHNPTHVVLMLGANDNRPDFYDENGEMFEVCKERYVNNMKKIVEIFLEFNVEVMICTITPYDEYTEGEGNKYLDKGCQMFRGFILDIAKTYNLKVIDFYACMSKLLKENGMKVISPDRLHPSELGYHVMAQCFLETLGFTKKADYETMPVFTGKLKERLDLEKFMRNLCYIEYEFLYPIRVKNGYVKYEEKSAYFREQKEKLPADDYTAIWIDKYEKEWDNWNVYMEKYLILTVELANSYIK